MMTMKNPESRAGDVVVGHGRMAVVNVPIAFLLMTQQMLHTAEEKNLDPERWELRFGEGALETLGRDVRRITAIDRLLDLPVTLPEEPGRMAGAVEVSLLCVHGGVRQFITAEMVRDSY